jgi:hypothetical protein
MVQMDLFSFAAQMAVEVTQGKPLMAVEVMPEKPQQEAVKIVREKPKTPVAASVKEMVVLPPEPRNFLSDGKTVMPTAKMERIEANLNAVRLLKAGRELDYVEKVALSRFSGWGGLTEVFLPENRHYSGLRELLSEEEYRTAQSSILDSFYTPESLIDFMWDIVRTELKVKIGKVA